LAGVAPNLLLVVFLLSSFFQSGFLLILALAISTFLVFAAFMPFWLFQPALIFSLVLAMKFAGGFLSGNKFLDFLIMLVLGTVGFYFFLNLAKAGSFQPALILKETIYNLVLGTAGWFFLRLFKRRQFLI